MAPGMMIVNQCRNISHWSIENEYENQFGEAEYPIRIFNAEYRTGLDVSLQLFQRDLDYVCHRRGLGFTVILMAPGETVITTRNSFRVSLLEDARIAIKPKMIHTLNGLRKYDAKQRGCFYNYERQLRFFKQYTQHNCEIECLANFTKAECECVPFYMPSR